MQFSCWLKSLPLCAIRVMTKLPLQREMLKNTPNLPKEYTSGRLKNMVNWTDLIFFLLNFSAPPRENHHP
jgi:hypothetical protein